MASTNSNAFLISVVAPAGVPYSLPSAGTAVAIGLNGALDVTPTGESWTTSNWAYSLFESFGGGVFVPTYSPTGAYVLAGTGGHAHPDNNGAAVFDFQTATWARLDNANGVPRPPNTSYSISAGNGFPWHEVSGSQVPLPPHPYGNAAYGPDGTKGSVYLIGRGAVGNESTGAPTAHRFDLATRLWSRASTAGHSRGTLETDAVWDAARNRWWSLGGGDMHVYSSLLYLDRATLTWNTFGSFSFPPSLIAGNGGAWSRAFLHDGMLVLVGGIGQRIWLCDPDLVSAGWIQPPMSGTFPASGVFSTNRWARYSNGNYYSYIGDGSNTLTRIRPPTNPKTGTWQIDTISVSGAALGTQAGLSDPHAIGHYNRLFYVPAIDCLAWIPGRNKPVYLIKPGS